MRDETQRDETKRDETKLSLASLSRLTFTELHHGRFRNFLFQDSNITFYDLHVRDSTSKGGRPLGARENRA